MTIKIVIVDDHALVRMGLAALLNDEDDLTVVGEAGSGDEILALYARAAPDIVISDLRMPGIDGQDAIRVLLGKHPDARVVVLSSYSTPEDTRRAAQAGVRAFVRKDVDNRALVDAIRRVHRGENLLAGAEDQVEFTLSSRETEILRLVASGMSNREIGERLSLTEGTVKTYVVRILDKLQARDRTEAVTRALRHGFLRLDEVPDARSRHKDS